MKADPTPQQVSQAIKEQALLTNLPMNSFGDDRGQANQIRQQVEADSSSSGSEQVMPVGPALPPGRVMRFPMNFWMKTRLKVLNENSVSALVTVDRLAQSVPAAQGGVSGVLDLSGGALQFGKVYEITNRCNWVLRIEFR
jgi:hypothetical protein